MARGLEHGICLQYLFDSPSIMISTSDPNSVFWADIVIRGATALEQESKTSQVGGKARTVAHLAFRLH
ncbi:uncharacterized protein ARMOST_22176 [Armillaria ostoyae]|uniref:Uncharacterized protein n=1 Tax=Armillaria ostoyae TaxID=47428 RepID=A0A284SC77_ARMOS|nr:uncharacterized protein ARMOST_22176 [Armillaria ostoyae]